MDLIYADISRTQAEKPNPGTAKVHAAASASAVLRRVTSCWAAPVTSRLLPQSHCCSYGESWARPEDPKRPTVDVKREGPGGWPQGSIEQSELDRRASP